MYITELTDKSSSYNYNNRPGGDHLTFLQPEVGHRRRRVVLRTEAAPRPRRPPPLVIAELVEIAGVTGGGRGGGPWSR